MARRSTLCFAVFLSLSHAVLAETPAVPTAERLCRDFGLDAAAVARIREGGTEAI